MEKAIVRRATCSKRKDAPFLAAACWFSWRAFSSAARSGACQKIELNRQDAKNAKRIQAKNAKCKTCNAKRKMASLTASWMPLLSMALAVRFEFRISSLFRISSFEFRT
jgi:hypothetical protein